MSNKIKLMESVKYCSPERYGHGTCLTKQELIKVAQDPNVNVPISNVTQTSKKVIHRKISQKLAPKCKNSEICWIDNLQNKDVKHELTTKAYRPRKPKSWVGNPRTWLNTYDILNVMRQYETRYKSFKFMGVYPIDFTERYETGGCIGDSLCDFHINNILSKNKKKFGMVLNLDHHNGGGFHWVAMYCSLNPRDKNFGIYYYDSVADPPDYLNHRKKYVTNFMKLVAQQVSEVFKEKQSAKFVISHNKIRKQYKGTECGVYSQIFITQMLKNIPFDEICGKMPKDDDVLKIRDYLYSPTATI